MYTHHTYSSELAMAVTTFRYTSFLTRVQVDQPPSRSLRATVRIAIKQATPDFLNLHFALIRLGVVRKPSSVHEPVSHLLKST